MIYVFYADKLYGEYEHWPNDLPDGAFAYWADCWHVVDSYGVGYPILKDNVEHTVPPATRMLLLLLT